MPSLLLGVTSVGGEATLSASLLFPVSLLSQDGLQLPGLHLPCPGWRRVQAPCACSPLTQIADIWKSRGTLAAPASGADVVGALLGLPHLGPRMCLEVGPCSGT